MLRTLVRLRRFWRKHQTLLWVVFLVSVLGGIFWWGLRLTHSPEKALWAAVPSDALLVLHAPAPAQRWTHWQSLPFWQEMRRVPYFGDAQAQADFWETLDLPAIKDLYASWHLVSGQQSAWVFYLSFGQSNTSDPWPALDRFKAQLSERGLQVASRQFQGQTIHEIKKGSQFIFGFLQQKDWWIGSYEPLLLDQVVRHRQVGVSLSPPVQPSPTDSLRVHLLPQNWDALTEAVLGVRLPLPVRASLPLDVSLSQERLLGMGTLPKDDGPTTAPFGVSERLLRYVPWQTALLLHQQIKPPEAPTPTIESWEDDYSFQYQKFQKTLGDQVALSILEKENRRSVSRLVIVPLQDVSTAQGLLQQFAQNTLSPKRKTPLVRRHESWAIQQLTIDEFPQAIFGEAFAGFAETYFVIQDGFLLLSNSVKVLQSLHDDLVSERTWARQLPEQRLWEQLDEQARLSVVINVPRLWQLLTESLQAPWQALFTAHPQAWLQVQFAAFQLIPTSQRTAATLLLTLTAPRVLASGEALPSGTLVQESQFQVSLSTKPYLVQNHIDRSWEVLVQDQNYDLHLISHEGRILWSYTLGEALVPQSLQQIDFYDNGKLQYAFATTRRIHVLDRLGQPVANFPITLPEKSEIQFLSVIDYDGSRDYRFLSADQNGRLYFYDKSGRGLHRWQPRSLGMRLATPVLHQRIDTKDVLLALQRDGTVHLLRRDAQAYDPFPLRFQMPFSSPVMSFPGSRLSGSEVVLMSEIGELIRLNLSGEILQRQTLPREEEARFVLLPDRVRGDSWLVIKKEKAAFEVLDSEGNTLFRVPTTDAALSDFQYYRFRPGREWLVWHNPKAGQAVIFRANEGSRLTALDTDHPISLLYSESLQRLDLYRCQGNRCELVRVQQF
ncbi:MAG: hypothetical protein ACFCUI_09560 [Bernardetiaceae bacterium]